MHILRPVIGWVEGVWWGALLGVGEWYGSEAAPCGDSCIRFHFLSVSGNRLRVRQWCSTLRHARWGSEVCSLAGFRVPHQERGFQQFHMHFCQV